MPETIVTTKKDFPTFLSILDRAIEQAIKEWEEKQKTKNSTN